MFTINREEKMTLKIVTDSTCDLPKEVIEKYGITVIPAYINFSDGSYLDGVEISRKEFYERLPTCETPPTTSAPAIGTFAKVYQELREKGATSILSIHISSALSGIYNVAVLAAEAMETIKVKTFDAGNLSLGTGLVVEVAAKMAQSGINLEEVLEKVKEVAQRTYTFAALDTLKFLQRSGRISKLKAGFGSLLQIKPILRMNQSKVAMEVSRTSKGAIQHLVNTLRALGPLEAIALVHTNVPDRAEKLRAELKTIFDNVIQAYSTDVTPVIGAHIGPGAVGFVVITAPQKG
jgi:DegV family protein with EDD domain